MYTNSPTQQNYLTSTTISITKPYPSSSSPSPSNDPYNYTLNDQLSRKYYLYLNRSMINKLPGRKDIDLGNFP